ncbi:hypothetical protein DRQ50_08330 [bacterium]|nr:MAG: hypothetical protein DRQ50_08330 [bacterium]
MRFRHTVTTIAIPLLVLALALPAQARWFGSGKGIEGSGDMETREFDLKTFEAIELGGAFSVEIRFGDKQSVAVTIDDNLWENLETGVSHGTFELDWDKNCEPDDDCKVVITMGNLERLEVHGACDATVKDFDSDRFEFNVHGAAELYINGQADELEINISGAGEVDARNLKAKHVKVRISGAGDAELYASESIDARISGAGNLDYWGNPDHEKTNVSGVGSIDAH